MVNHNMVTIFILTPQLLLFFHLFNSIKYFLQNEDHPFLIYKACIDPFSFYDVHLTKVLPWDNVLLFVYDSVIVLGNLYLWKYLSGQTETNHALKEVDRKKERKRNFLTAKDGVITSAATVFSYIFCGIFYSLKVVYEFEYIIFLVPIGAQEMLVCSFFCLVQVCLELLIFTFQPQFFNLHFQLSFRTMYLKY